MPADDFNTLVGEFVNVMHKYGHGSGKLINPHKDYYTVNIGRSSGLMQDDLIIHFFQSDVSSILTGLDTIVIMLKTK